MDRFLLALTVSALILFGGQADAECIDVLNYFLPTTNSQPGNSGVFQQNGWLNGTIPTGIYQTYNTMPGQPISTLQNAGTLTVQVNPNSVRYALQLFHWDANNIYLDFDASGANVPSSPGATTGAIYSMSGAFFPRRMCVGTTYPVAQTITTYPTVLSPTGTPSWNCSNHQAPHSTSTPQLPTVVQLASVASVNLQGTMGTRNIIKILYSYAGGLWEMYTYAAGKGFVIFNSNNPNVCGSTNCDQEYVWENSQIPILPSSIAPCPNP